MKIVGSFYLWLVIAVVFFRWYGREEGDGSVGARCGHGRECRSRRVIARLDGRRIDQAARTRRQRAARDVATAGGENRHRALEQHAPAVGDRALAPLLGRPERRRRSNASDEDAGDEPEPTEPGHAPGEGYQAHGATVNISDVVLTRQARAR